MSPPEAPSRSPRIVALSLLAVAVLLVLGFAWAVNRALPPAAPDVGEAASVLRVPVPLPDFSLQDQHGEAFGRDRLEDRWSFLFFGYTHCPDVCPGTLAVLSDVRARLLQGDAPEPQFLFVSVDPERDDAGRIGPFVEHFDPAFLGLRGTPEALEVLTSGLGIYHGRAAGASPEAYLVDHTAAVLLVDPGARLVALFDDPHEPDGVAQSYRKIAALGARP